MNQILITSCIDLLRRLSLAKASLSGRNFPTESQPCLHWIENTFTSLEEKVRETQHYVSFNIDDEDFNLALINELIAIKNDIEVIDSNILHPLYRLKDDDILALKIIDWLHKIHPQTISKSFILSNGTFSIAPSKNYPTLYWLPVTSQLGLLHLPLLFHEFGHQLFSYHEHNMRDLIGDFQKILKEKLRPPITQNDDKYRGYMERASDIVETWQEWMEELFCDSVGLTIGGKSYLFAFSYFTRLGGRAEFFLPEKSLAKRSHPVTLLRIRFLIERAKGLGLEREASELENDWKKISQILKVKEDYFGFYSDDYKDDILQTLEHMLIEADPISFINTGIRINQEIKLNFITLLNDAWERYLQSSIDYQEWENGIIKSILSS